MPVITVNTYEGKTPELKKRWIQELTRISMEVLGIDDPSIFTIIINEVPKQNWGKNGVPASELD